jgi:hypothetical protein
MMVAALTALITTVVALTMTVDATMTMTVDATMIGIMMMMDLACTQWPSFFLLPLSLVSAVA